MTGQQAMARGKSHFHCNPTNVKMQYWGSNGDELKIWTEIGAQVLYMSPHAVIIRIFFLQWHGQFSGYFSGPSMEMSPMRTVWCVLFTTITTRTGRT